MTLLATNPAFRSILATTGGTLEHREPQALSSTAWEIRRDGEVLASGAAAESVRTAPSYVVYTVNVPTLPIETDYQLVLAPGADQRVRTFDVGREAQAALLSLADIQRERQGLNRALEQVADMDGCTVDDVAWSLATKAREMLEDLLGDRLLELEGASTLAGRDPQRRGAVYLRLWMVADWDRLRRVERYLAMYEFFWGRKDGSTEDEDAEIATGYLNRAKAALNASGLLRLDLDQDGVPDAAVRPSRSFRCTRVA